MHGAEGRPSSVNSLVQLRHNNFDHRDQLGPFGRSVTTTLSRSDRARILQPASWSTAKLPASTRR